MGGKVQRYVETFLESLSNNSAQKGQTRVTQPPCTRVVVVVVVVGGGGGGGGGRNRK